MSGNDSVFGYSVVGNGTLFSPSNSYNDPFEDMFTKVVFICAYSTVFALCVFGKYNIFICLSVLILPGVKIILCNM